MPEAKRIFGDEPRLRYSSKAMDALDGADALVIITEGKEFRSADMDTIKQKLKTPLVFDGRNLYDPKFVRAQGIQYLPIGRLDSLMPTQPEAFFPASLRRASGYSINVSEE